jgi:hypothetical protein
MKIAFIEEYALTTNVMWFRLRDDPDDHQRGDLLDFG